MEELWAEIDGFPNYIVSNYGEVRNRYTNKKLRPRENSKGYMRVVLMRAGHAKEFYVHRLVGRGFFGEFRRTAHISHVNGDKRNNLVNNLKLRGGTRNQTGNGTNKPGPKSRRIRIVETEEVFKSVRDCARYIGGDYSSIYKCLRGEHSNHLGYTFEYLEDN